MTNQKLRTLMYSKNIKQYELAKLIGVSESTMYRMLRDELPEEETNRLIAILEKEVY